MSSLLQNASWQSKSIVGLSLTLSEASEQQAQLVALQKALKLAEEDRDAYKYCYEFVGGK